VYSNRGPKGAQFFDNNCYEDQQILYKKAPSDEKRENLARTPGHNHFNAKESGSGRMRRRRWKVLEMSASDRSRFPP
jgi:hypothetical protein